MPQKTAESKFKIKWGYILNGICCNIYGILEMLMVPLPVVCVFVYEIFIDEVETTQNKDNTKETVPSWKKYDSCEKICTFGTFGARLIVTKEQNRSPWLNA